MGHELVFENGGSHISATEIKAQFSVTGLIIVDGGAQVRCVCVHYVPATLKIDVLLPTSLYPNLGWLVCPSCVVLRCLCL